MKLNNKGQGQMMMYLMIVMFLFGGLGGLKIGKLFGGGRKAVAVQKDEGHMVEYYKDKIKGTEFRREESYKMQNKGAANASGTIGSSIGAFIDKSITVIIYTVIIGFVLLFFTGINIFKRFKKIASDVMKYRKALKQTIKGVDVASLQMNGEDKILKATLAMKQDEDTKNIINEMKNE